ncbi:MAG: C40 family peptidase [Bacteroidetes bacterium]|nr:C40 family peptidase [Bacteroidota bacterium]
MSFGICNLSVVPCRKEPSGASEMVTQLLFGEHYAVIEDKEDWLRIKIAYDGYECWISAKQHVAIPESAYKLLNLQNPILSSELVQIIANTTDHTVFPLTIGATLPGYIDRTCKIEHTHYTFEGQVSNTQHKKGVKELIDTAFLFLNAPYLWGGRNPFGIDCSGFVQLVYKLNGYKLPRDAYQQVEMGHPLSFVEEAQAGDLAFFDNEEGRIVHVGIVLDEQRIIHASGSVRVDKFDHYGIFHSDTKKYSHMLRVIKKVI